MQFHRINLNRKRHFLLKKLSEKFLEQADNNGSNLTADILGLSFEQIDSLLNVKIKERELIISELDINKEIAFYEFKERGCFIDKNGFSALAEKKYINRNQDIYLKWLRNFVQLFIPVASLIIAYVALSMNIAKNKKENNEEIKNLENRIEQIENRKSVIKKAELSDYINSELSTFYRDFKNEITEIIWTDEPPAKLSGVIFGVSENEYYEIELDSIPELYKLNLEMNWKINEVGNSRIRNIKLIKK